MDASFVDLPDDVASLRALILAEREQQAAVEQALAAAKAGLKAKVLEIEKLKVELARLRRMSFGRSSEKIDRRIEQLELLLEDIEESHPEFGDEPEAMASEAQGESLASPAARRRRQLPESLPRQEIRHEPAGDCSACGGSLRSVGEDVTEILDYVPGRFRVVRHVRPALSCRSCETMVQAPMPSLPVERGLPSPALLSHVLVSKFCDHLPLYRQSGIYAREGVLLSRSLLAGWVGKSAELVAPLVEAVARHVVAGGQLHADDTPVPVLAPGRGKTRLGRQWVYLRDERPHAGPAPPAVLYRYTPDRKGEHPCRELEAFRGALHADGYAGFARLYEGRDGSAPAVVEIACWAHVRRKIHDVYVSDGSPIARAALERIGRLFDIERELSGRPPDERRCQRQARSRPLLDDIETFFQSSLRRLSGKTELAAAMRYALARWTALTRYVENGRAEISNNAAERAIRPLTLGRKNWLFAGSDSGGHRAAAIYTLVETARLNGLNPQAYLTDLLTRIADHPINRVDDLLPWNIQLPDSQSATAA